MMLRPALYALHRRFPQASIDVLIPEEMVPLFEDDREIREVLSEGAGWFSRKATRKQKWTSYWSWPKRLAARDYDLAVDFRGDLRNIVLLFLAGIPHRWGYGDTGGGFLLTRCLTGRNDVHQVEENLRLLEPFQVETPGAIPPIVYSQQKKQEFWRHFGTQLGSGHAARVVVHPGAGYPSKKWPELRYQAIVDRLVNELGVQVVLIGSAEEKEAMSNLQERLPKIVDLRGRTVLKELPILMDHADLYLGNDSGPAHLAAAQGLEMVILFSGANAAHQWKPWSPHLHLIKYDVPCSPCEAQDCPLSHHDCMMKIEPEQVFQKIRVILSHHRIAGKTTHEEI